MIRLSPDPPVATGETRVRLLSITARLRRPALTLALAMALSMAGTAGAQQSSPQSGQQQTPPASVVLSFGWLPGMEAAVSTTSSRVRVAEQRSSVSTTQAYRMRVLAEGGHLRLQFVDAVLKVKVAPSAGKPSREPPIPVNETVGLMPEYRISEAGRFMGVVDISAYQEKLRQHYARLLPKDADPQTRRKLIDALQMASAPHALNASAEQHWQGMVGAWVGGRLELGREYTRQSAEPIALIAGERVQMNHVFAARRRLACTAESTGENCVELEVISEADPADAARVVESIAARADASSGPAVATLKALEIRNVTRLVAEPDGLIPHRSSVSQTTRGLARVDGRERPVEQISTVQTIYTYR